MIRAPPVFLFEPHQPEQCRWDPNVLVDITAVWDLKRKAFECMAAQEHLWEYYTRVALQRGAQASRNSDRKSGLRGSLPAALPAGDLRVRLRPRVGLGRPRN